MRALRAGICIVVCLSSLPTAALLPAAVDPKARYLFYLHGAWIEEHDVDVPHPDYGVYEYQAIIRSLSDKGFVVISEARRGQIDADAYARSLVADVNALIGRGVPPDHISVVGHSKGAHMVLLAASTLAQPEMHFVIMAGCQKAGTALREGYEDFLKAHAPAVEGHVLSIYDAADTLMSTCRDIFAAANRERLTWKETALETGRGHGLFFRPDPIWIDPVAAWCGDSGHSGESRNPGG